MIPPTVRIGLAVGLWMACGALQTAADVGKKVPQPAKMRQAPYQLGKAVWYGGNFHGRETASGEVYNMYRLTAAHRELALGTRVKVTNLNNGKSVVVKINDRGPVKEKGRIIDLSYAASRRLGMLRSGVAPVRIDLLLRNEARRS